MSNTIEWFDLVELDEMVRQSNYFNNYRIDIDSNVWIAIYLKNSRSLMNLNEFMEDLLAFKNFFKDAETPDFSIEKKCIIIQFDIEKIKGYAQHNKEAGYE